LEGEHEGKLDGMLLVLGSVLTVGKSEGKDESVKECNVDGKAEGADGGFALGTDEGETLGVKDGWSEGKAHGFELGKAEDWKDLRKAHMWHQSQTW
jgi:hypothetical protein